MIEEVKKEVEVVEGEVVNESKTVVEPVEVKPGFFARAKSFKEKHVGKITPKTVLRTGLGLAAAGLVGYMIGKSKSEADSDEDYEDLEEVNDDFDNEYPNESGNEENNF